MELEDTFGRSDSESHPVPFKAGTSELASHLSPTTQSTCSTVYNESSKRKKKKKKNKARQVDNSEDSKEDSKEDLLSIRALLDKNRTSPQTESLFSWRESKTSPEEIKIEFEN